MREAAGHGGGGRAPNRRSRSRAGGGTGTGGSCAADARILLEKLSYRVAG